MVSGVRVIFELLELQFRRFSGHLKFLGGAAVIAEWYGEVAGFLLDRDTRNHFR